MKIGSKEYLLLHNGEAMFAIRKKYGKDFEIFKVFAEDTDESFTVACEIAAILLEQGELLRRFQGHAPQPILPAQLIKLLTMPAKIPNFKREVGEAVLDGYRREIEDDEIDLGLVELNKKKEMN